MTFDDVDADCAPPTMREQRVTLRWCLTDYLVLAARGKWLTCCKVQKGLRLTFCLVDNGFYCNCMHIDCLLIVRTHM